MKVLIIKLFSPSCYFSSLRPKYLPYNSILEDLQPMFFPQYKALSFTTKQNNRQNYSSIYFNLYVFRSRTQDYERNTSYQYVICSLILHV